MSRLAVLAGALTVVASCSPAGIGSTTSAGLRAHYTGPVYSGVFEPESPDSYSQVTTFAKVTGQHQNITVYYSGWGQPFDTAFAKLSESHKTEVLVQLYPAHGAVGAVAAGKQDSYLRSYARQVKAFGHPVIISFGQEMNGNWYIWGQGKVSPASFTAAWRRMVTVFRQAGASNVTWLWDVNTDFTGGYPVAPWWPGDSYVTWVGLDGYYTRPRDTFSSVFGSTLTEIGKLTGKPVLIAETASGPDSGSAREAQIRGLFTGVRSSGLMGFVWFDQKQDDGPYHQDWRLEDDPAALAAFRAAVKEYG
jgi:mannan endo-1,4-beta-mannosidase